MCRLSIVRAESVIYCLFHIRVSSSLFALVSVVPTVSAVKFTIWLVASLRGCTRRTISTRVWGSG